MSIRLCIIADIHHGEPSLTKRGDAALPLMEEFTRFVADSAPDRVLDLGDRISDVDRETDLRLEKEVAEAFAMIEAPVDHLNGNHDRDHLSVAENEKILSQSMEHELVDLGAWQMALWRADSKIHRYQAYNGFILREMDLIWLARIAATATKPLLVVSHVPVSGHSQIGNYYFENNPEVSVYPNAERARAALSKARVPVVCLAGHVHWNTVTPVDGVTHLTQQSLTESFTTDGEPAAAWGMIELGEDVHWQVHGLDPFQCRFTPTTRRWTSPINRFSDHLDFIHRAR